MTKEYMEKEKKKTYKKNLSNGGAISQLMAVTPLMRKKISQNRTVFGNEQLLAKEELTQLKSEDKKSEYLLINNLKYKDNNTKKISNRKIDEEFIWNEIVKSNKGKIDYKIVSKELAKKYLEPNETYVDVEYITYNK